MYYAGFKRATWGEQMFYSFDQSSFFQNDIHWTWSTDQGLREQDINQSPDFSHVPPLSPWRSAPSPCSSLAGQLSILLSLFPKTWRARCQLKAPRHSCPSTQLHSWPTIQHKDSCVMAGPQGAVVNIKVEQELMGHLGKCWFAYRRKAGWLIWKGTWRFSGVKHVVLSPPCPWAQDGITEPFYRLPIILDGFWHK